MNKNYEDTIAEAKKDFVKEVIEYIEKENHFPWEEPNFTNFPKSLSKLNALGSQADPREAEYKNTNLIKLSMVASKNEYKDSRWGTYLEIKKMGGSVPKGKSTKIWTAKPIICKRKNLQTGEDEIIYMQDKNGNFLLNKEGKQIPKKRIVFSQKCVWNVEQAIGLNLEPEPPLSELDPKEKCLKMENIISNSEAPVKHDQYTGDGRFYSPVQDEIHVPPVEMFKSMSAYYATVAHEIGHSTGHETRNNRDLGGSLGSERYAREELVAELTSVFLSQELGIKIPQKELDNHAEYLRGWGKKTFTEKPEELFAIIGDAEKAVSYIKTHMMNKDMKQEQSIEHAEKVIKQVEKQPKIAPKKVVCVKKRVAKRGKGISL